MRNQLSLLLCDIYMQYFEERIFIVHMFSHWYRYVNAFVLFISNADFFNLLSSINQINYCIQFTFENHNSLFLKYWFLNILSGVFRKSFSVSLPNHVLSNYPSQQKMATFSVYVYGTLCICPDPSNLSYELNLLFFLEDTTLLSLITP